MPDRSLRQRITQIGSAATVATALITQPLLAQASELVLPILQAALASVATRSDRRDKVPSQLVLQPSGRASVEFVGHRSHSSHSSHSSHRSHYSGTSSHSSHSSHTSHHSSSPSYMPSVKPSPSYVPSKSSSSTPSYSSPSYPPFKSSTPAYSSPSTATPLYAEPRPLPPTASPPLTTGGTRTATSSPTARQGLIDPTAYDIPLRRSYRSDAQLDLSKAEDRFDLISVTRGMNGVLSARVLDRKQGEERKLRLFDGMDPFIVTDINADDRTITLIDSTMKPAILSARAETK